MVALAASCFSDRATGAPSADLSGACQLSDVTGLAGPDRAIVVIRNFAFSPDTLRVRAGTTVVWLNCDAKADPHTSTADAGTWDSSFLPYGSSFKRVFSTLGAFAYHCVAHPFMKATVIVQ